MKVKLNPMFEQVSGQLGELVFREVRGETVASRKPAGNSEPTPGQTAHRELFKQAAAYGKSVMADQSARAIYEEAARNKNMPVFALTIADFFNAPTINDVDVSAYGGNIGDIIKVHALDDIGVTSVHLTLSNAQNNAPIESGNAIETASGSGMWLYTVTAAVNPDTMVNINVVATDRPGGTAVAVKTKSF